jgi:hypothetical protein
MLILFSLLWHLKKSDIAFLELDLYISLSKSKKSLIENWTRGDGHRYNLVKRVGTTKK